MKRTERFMTQTSRIKIMGARLNAEVGQVPSDTLENLQF
jgi:hypothetical protein